tara:strand:- start:805 stop:996 length:192 start_codon:yes stop_codon:yes gene_type:complete
MTVKDALKLIQENKTLRIKLAEWQAKYTEVKKELKELEQRRSCCGCRVDPDLLNPFSATGDPW